MVHSGLMLRRPSLSSAVLGVVALTLTGVIVGRVSANDDTAPADFAPVVITSVAADEPTDNPTPYEKPSPASKPGVTNRSVTGIQIKPTPQDISDDSGDDHGGMTSSPTSGISGSDDGGGSSGKDGSDSGSSGSDGTSDSTDHD